jgi:hypothetical protein
LELMYNNKHELSIKPSESSFSVDLNVRLT